MDVLSGDGLFHHLFHVLFHIRDKALLEVVVGGCGLEEQRREEKGECNETVGDCL